MMHPQISDDRRVVLRIVCIYALVAALWIYLSDQLVGLIIHDPDTIVQISVYKGFFFILVTVVLLYKLISGHTLQTAASRQAVADKQLQLEQLNSSLELRINQAVAQLREKDQLLIQQSRLAAMGEMISNIAHQWRQPLNLLAILVQEIPLAQARGDLSQEFVTESVGKAKQIIFHLSQTIDDFRNFFKPDKEATHFTIGSVVRRSIALLEGSFDRHNIRISVAMDGDPAIIGYPNEFSQVILNILNNARDALLERSISDPRIDIQIRSEQGKRVLTISDNAGGIAEEIMDKIFDPYFTTKGPDHGTGIGLFMAKAIIERNMGGSLTVSRAEHGARFRIEV